MMFLIQFINSCVSPIIEILCPSFFSQSLHVRDIVRDSLEKDPVDRTPEDIEILLEFTQKLEAFNHMTMAVRRALCKGKILNLVPYTDGKLSFPLDFFTTECLILSLGQFGTIGNKWDNFGKRFNRSADS